MHYSLGRLHGPGTYWAGLRSNRSMSQARVTDFFSQRKKGVAAKQRGGTGISRTRSGSKQNKDAPSSVHDEFVRLIDEAVGLQDGPSAEGSTVSNRPSSPRTPKRTAAESGFDLGAAVFSTTADHSTAKKSRPGDTARGAKANVPSRKKLVLPQDTAQAGEERESRHRAQDIKALGKEDITALKARLQRIKKHAEDRNSPVQSAVAPQDASSIASTLARANELAARAQRRKEDSKQTEAQTEPQTEDSSDGPAYQRFHTLGQATPPGLTLPYSYKLLAEMFRSMDTLVAMLYNRSETPTYPKIRQGVQDMMHRRFEESHVAQIKTVFPEAYTFRQEKNIPTFNCSIKKSSYQLTVEPVIHCERSEARSVLSASRLLSRRQVFHMNLLSIVKQHHKVFLSLLVPPVSVPEDKLTRWHPRFNVDTVPSIPSSCLPQPPHSHTLTTAQEVLDKARSLITPKMEKALVSLAVQTEGEAAESKESPGGSPAAAVPAALKGVSQALLDRIRAKEAQKLQAAMTRNPQQEERLLMLSRLPELARILRSVFIAEKKAALIMEVACSRMVASYRSALSTGDMEKHIRLLSELDPAWLTIHPIRKDLYLKLNRNMELNVVVDKLNSRLKDEERL